MRGQSFVMIEFKSPEPRNVESMSAKLQVAYSISQAASPSLSSCNAFFQIRLML